MYSQLFPSFVAGLIAAALFVFVLATGLGFFFLFLPTLPLFWLGLSRAPFFSLIAALIAGLGISLITDLSVGLFFLIALGFPAFYINQLAVRSRIDEATQIWFPIGLIFSQLALYACALLAITGAYYHLQGIGFEAMIAEHIRATFAQLGAQYAEAVEMLASRFAFLIFTMGIWLWGLALYAHAWCVNHWLVKQSQHIRPDFAITVFLPPHSLLGLLGIAAFASLAGSPQMAFIGKCLLTSLLLPYFFLGAALMHEGTKNWPSRRFLLFFVYFLALTQFIPALILAGMGIFYHIKHLSGGRDSSRS